VFDTLKLKLKSKLDINFLLSVNHQKENGHMQITINVPDNLSPEKLQQKIKEIEANLQKEADSIQEEEKMEEDPWIEFLGNIDQYAVETGIEDLAENHDHYLYGTPKH